MFTFRDAISKVPDGFSRDALRKFSLAQRASGRAQSVNELALALGFDVTLCKLPKSVAGMLIREPFAANGYEIKVNQDHSVEKRRWTLMHEIAHFFLHRDHNDFLADESYRATAGFHFYREDEQKEEREANEFAAAIFFGDGALSASNAYHSGDVQKIARSFGLSTKAVEIALKRNASPQGGA